MITVFKTQSGWVNVAHMISAAVASDPNGKHNLWIYTAENRAVMIPESDPAFQKIITFLDSIAINTGVVLTPVPAHPCPKCGDAMVKTANADDDGMSEFTCRACKQVVYDY